MTEDMTFYLTRRWSVVRSEERDSLGAYPVLTISELPGFVVAARTDTELDKLFWPALEAFIQSYLDDGEVPPTPKGPANNHPDVLEDAPQVKTARVGEPDVSTWDTAESNYASDDQLVTA